MKKNLIKLSFIATVPNVLAQPIMLSTHHQQLSQEKTEISKIKRNVSENSWFQNLDKTYNIGIISFNDKITIEEKFSNYLVNTKNIRLDAFDILDVTDIKYNSANIKVRNLGNHMNKVIKVDFKTIEINLRTVIVNINLEQIEDNSAKVIHAALQKKNPDLEKIESEIKIINIRENVALVITGKNIENYYYNKPLNEKNVIVIWFDTDNYLINTYIDDVNLGILPNASIKTIIQKLKEKNKDFPDDFKVHTLSDFKIELNSNYLNNIGCVSIQGSYEPKKVPFILTEQDFYRPATDKEIKNDKIKDKITDFKNKNSVELNFFLNLNLSKTYKIIDKYTQGENIKPGYVYYVGMDGKVYLKNQNGIILNEFKDIEGKVIDIKLNRGGIAVVTTNKSTVYHLDLFDWKAKKLEIESKDLNKEIKLYYQNDKSNVEISSDWWYQSPNDIIVKTFNLGPLDPTKYKYIEFKGEPKDFDLTRVSWGNESWKTNRNLANFTKDKKFELKEILRNAQITLLNSQEIKNESPLLISSGKIYSFTAYIEYQQTIGITFFWWKDNYYLQVLAHQECYHNSGVNTGGAMFLNLGTGIRLYN